MSKKFFITLLALVFTIGGLATVFTASYFSPLSEVKRGFLPSDDAKSFTITVTQSNGDILVNKKASLYEKDGEEYFVTEKLTTLNSDAFSSNAYITEESEFSFKNDFSPSDFFTFKRKYFEKITREEVIEGFTVFSAKVKESFTDEFLKLSDFSLKITDVYFSIATFDGTVSFLEVSFFIDGDKFIVEMNFDY